MNKDFYYTKEKKYFLYFACSSWTTQLFVDKGWAVGTPDCWASSLSLLSIRGKSPGSNVVNSLLLFGDKIEKKNNCGSGPLTKSRFEFSKCPDPMGMF